MRKKLLAIALSAILTLGFTSCDFLETSSTETQTVAVSEEGTESQPEEGTETASTATTTYVTTESTTEITTAASTEVITEASTENDVSNLYRGLPDFEVLLETIPEFDGNRKYIEINNNKPFFETEGLSTKSYETYGDLDKLGRCTVAESCVGTDLMPTEERGSIGEVRPTGFAVTKYPELISGKYLYNRCHLIGFQLTGENANTKNLITGTRFLNVDGMLNFENKVGKYLKTHTENHVQYRVTPIFYKEELVCRGVLMEAYSIEDQGAGVSFNVYCYNNQPGITIDYATGSSENTGEYLEKARNKHYQSVILPKESTAEDGKTSEEVSGESATFAPEANETKAATSEPQSTYICNTNTMKFHLPGCSSLSRMSERNKMEVTGTRQEVIDMGYEPCQRCNP